MIDPWRATAGELVAAVNHREVSPTEVVEIFLERIAATDPVLHAYCLLDADGALAAAERLTRKLVDGTPLGPLAGVPVAVKDLIPTAGLRTTGGSLAYRDHVPAEDDVCVERLRAAGAIVIGKTNVSELGYGGVGHNPVHPTTRNPWNPAMTSGGSSAGSAAAVAVGAAPVALGSDGGGSIRIPSAFCGVVGVKASMGRVPLYPGCRDDREPGMSSWESLEHIGPLARTVSDAALLLSVIAGPDPRDRHSIPTSDVDWLGCLDRPPHGLRIGFTEDWGYAAVDPEVRRLVRAAARLFENDLGCRVTEFVAPWPDTSAVHTAIVALDTDLTGMRRLPRPSVPGSSPGLTAILAREWTATEFTDAQTRRKEICRLMAGLMSGYDLLITPTTAVPAFPAGQDGVPVIDGRPVGPDGWTPFAAIANLTGQPAASIPCGLTGAGLPVGLQLIGRHLGDETVLAAASAYLAAAGHTGAPI
ncbi:amidase [Kribbella sp. NPDC059898]|uniref:amidase n=1 Tax=Kribbella sp. NPDC059898 TaxID=3346995 RepID=UPI003651C3EE